MARAGSVIVAAVIGLALGLATVVVTGESGPDPLLATAAAADEEVEPAAAVLTADPVPSAPPSSEPAEPEEPAEPAEPETSTVGEPSRVTIPAIDVDAELVALGLNDDGSMETPDFGLGGWYDPGPDPGDAGPAVIAAHVDSVDGPDVFFRLRELEAGDEVTVRHAEGGATTFVVQHSEQQHKEDLPVERIWNDTDEVVLRLITCGGDFDRERRSYESNVIVYATAETT